MTKQERNDIILQSLQAELQEKPYAKEKLSDKFEQCVQGLVAQGNQLLGGQSQSQMSQEAGESGGPASPEEPAPDEEAAAPSPDEQGGEQ